VDKILGNGAAAGASSRSGSVFGCLFLLLTATAGAATADAPPGALEAPYLATPLAPGASTTANAWRTHEGQLYRRKWGVEVLGVRSTSSGYMLSFRYRVLDPERAQPINDAKNRAYVVDEVSGARLAVPAMENIGELRQTTRPIAGQNYFIVFGNPGQLVKKGGRVSVVIGNFRVPNLVVE
jgi:hypothetical protein